MYLTKRRTEKFDLLCCDVQSDSFPTVITTASIAAKRIPKDLAQPRKVRKSGNGSMRAKKASNVVHTGIKV